MSVTAPSALAALLVARAVYGAGLLLAPPRALSAVARTALDPETVLVARVLGARQLVQAVALSRHPQRSWRLAGAAVDALHAASMAALARFGSAPVHRRLAARDARTAALLSVSGLVT